MKYLFSFLVLLLAAACGNNANQQTTTADNIASTGTLTNGIVEEEIFVETDTFFVVIADTSISYYTLNKRMYVLAASHKMEVDTMNRYHNPQKGIVLPDDDEDELYAGAFVPRRFASGTLSIEPLSMYDTTLQTDDKMALVAGMFQQPAEADSLSRILNRAGYRAYVLEAAMYIGCMH